MALSDYLGNFINNPTPGQQTWQELIGVPLALGGAYLSGRQGRLSALGAPLLMAGGGLAALGLQGGQKTAAANSARAAFPSIADYAKTRGINSADDFAKLDRGAQSQMLQDAQTWTQANTQAGQIQSALKANPQLASSVGPSSSLLGTLTPAQIASGGGVGAYEKLLPTPKTPASQQKATWRAVQMKDGSVQWVPGGQAPPAGSVPYSKPTPATNINVAMPVSPNDLVTGPDGKSMGYWVRSKSGAPSFEPISGAAPKLALVKPTAPAKPWTAKDAESLRNNVIRDARTSLTGSGMLGGEKPPTPARLKAAVKARLLSMGYSESGYPLKEGTTITAP